MALILECSRCRSQMPVTIASVPEINIIAVILQRDKLFYELPSNWKRIEGSELCEKCLKQLAEFLAPQQLCVDSSVVYSKFKK